MESTGVNVMVTGFAVFIKGLAHEANVRVAVKIGKAGRRALHGAPPVVDAKVALHPPDSVLGIVQRHPGSDVLRYSARTYSKLFGDFLLQGHAQGV